MSHILLSMPFTRLHSSPYSTGPIFVSHFYDLQTPFIPNLSGPVQYYSTGGDKAHTGPPATNVEVMLKGDKVAPAADDEGRALEGEVWVRGPSILERVDQGRTVIDG